MASVLYHNTKCLAPHWNSLLGKANLFQVLSAEMVPLLTETPTPLEKVRMGDS